MRLGVEWGWAPCCCILFGRIVGRRCCCRWSFYLELKGRFIGGETGRTHAWTLWIDGTFFYCTDGKYHIVNS
jgi:hypothetical protein